MKPRLEARVYYKSRLICSGVNSYVKSSALQRRYGKEKQPFVHAELDAIREACYHIGVHRLSQCELHIERRTAAGQLVMARPCDACKRALEAFRFKEVWFTDSNGQWQRFM